MEFHYTKTESHNIYLILNVLFPILCIIALREFTELSFILIYNQMQIIVIVYRNYLNFSFFV